MGGVDGFALHEILAPHRRQWEQPVKHKGPMLKHPLERKLIL